MQLRVMRVTLLLMRELIELTSSLGGLLIYSAVWWGNRANMYMIDMVEECEYLRAVIVMAVDFVIEFVMFSMMTVLLRRFAKVDAGDVMTSLVNDFGVAIFATSTCMLMFCWCFIR